jgi:hypothetical protein
VESYGDFCGLRHGRKEKGKAERTCARPNGPSGNPYSPKEGEMGRKNKKNAVFRYDWRVYAFSPHMSNAPFC